jgi:hypothetical protein
LDGITLALEQTGGDAVGNSDSALNGAWDRCKKMKKIIRPCFLAITVLLMMGCFSKGDLAYNDGSIKVITQQSILPHGTGNRTLKVKDKSFSHLYSYRFLSIPEWNAIAFVTHREAGQFKLHILSLESMEEVIIKTEFPFGGQFRAKDSPKVEALDSDRLVVREKAFPNKNVAIRINRKQKSIDHGDYRWRDPNTGRYCRSPIPRTNPGFGEPPAPIPGGPSVTDPSGIVEPVIVGMGYISYRYWYNKAISDCWAQKFPSACGQNCCFINLKYSKTPGTPAVFGGGTGKVVKGPCPPPNCSTISAPNTLFLTLAW